MSEIPRIRPDIASMSAYTPTTSLEVFAERLGLSPADLIKLDANENPFGPSPRVRAALGQLAHIEVYPDPESGRLRALLADYVGAPAGQILCGAGADELIEIILQLFIEPGDAIINCPPTFAMYSFDAPLYHARVIDVGRRADFSLDLDAIEKAARQHHAKLIFLCSPNNPSGNCIPRADVMRLLQLPATLVIDEAYIEFAEADSLAADAQRSAQSDRFAHDEQVGGPGGPAHRLWHLPRPADAAALEDQAALQYQPGCGYRRASLARGCRSADGARAAADRAARAHASRLRRAALSVALSQPSQFRAQPGQRHNRERPA